MTTATQIDRRAVMLEAWGFVKSEMANGARYRISMMRYNLRRAWANAKARARGLKAVDDVTPAERELAVLQNKRHQSSDDLALMAALRNEIAHHDAAEDYAAKRKLIVEADQIATVTFAKADGSERVMQVKPRAMEVKGHRATDAGQRAAITRKVRHPHLLPVWDAEANAPRSINLATVSQIDVAGSVHTY